MLTLCGVVLKSTDMLSTAPDIVRAGPRKLAAAACEFLNSLSPASFELTPNWDHYITINMPHLSVREKFFIDKCIPLTGTDEINEVKEIQNHLGFLLDADESQDMIQSYCSFYRFFPSFHRVVY